MDFTPEFMEIVKENKRLQEAFSSYIAMKLEVDTMSLKFKKIQMEREFERSKEATEGENEVVGIIKKESF